VLLDLNQWDDILDDLRHMLLQHYGIDHVTLQPETPARVVRSEDC
jgi:cobalt-zinc-cadmium efflux system protein